MEERVIEVIKPYEVKNKESCITVAREIAEKSNFTDEEYAIIEPLCSGQIVSNITFDSAITAFINSGLTTEKELIEKNVIIGVIERSCKIVDELSCTYDGDLVPGAEFIHNQYTYRYKQEYSMDENAITGWSNIEEDGWGVILTDKTSTDSVNKPICSNINGKPLVSTSYMFIEVYENSGVITQAKEIDVSSFDTSNVTNMAGMFAYTSAKEINGLDKLETSNVTDMSRMFVGSNATVLDLSNFNTSQVTNMGEMFDDSHTTVLDISNFDTSKVTNMHRMFAESSATTINFPDEWTTGENASMAGMFNYSQATTIDLRGLDTSKVISMQSMFSTSQVTTIYFPDKWTTGENTDMLGMFEFSKATTIDLSGLDTSNVVEMALMFHYSEATTIKFPDEWTTGENARMSNMFAFSKVTTIDLSGLDTSNVIDMTDMFSFSHATTGYARTQADADKFNATSNKPDTLTFIVKPSS